MYFCTHTQSIIMKYFAFLSAFVSLSLLPFAQIHSSALNFTYINTTNGLSQNTVRSICIDKEGFLWAGTLDGLNRYDGNNFVVYKPQLGNSHALSDPRIREVVEDANGFIWVKKYDNTFSCYSPVLDMFIDVVDKRGHAIDLSFTNIYFASDSTIFLYGGTAGAAKISVMNRDVPLAVWTDCDNKYCDHVEDSNGNTWLCGDDLVRVKPNGSVKHYDIICLKRAKSMSLQHDVILMVGETNKLARFNVIKDVSLKPLLTPNGERLQTCQRADSSMLLLTTRQDGIFAYDVATNKFVEPSEINAQNIGDDSQALTDNLGDAWICDHSGIIYRYNTATRKFVPIRVISPEIAKVIDNERYVIFVDSKGNYWITTYGCGLVKYDPQSGSIETIRYSDSPNGLSSDYLLSIAEDDYGNIWVGSEYAGIIKISHRPYNVNLIKPEVPTSLGSSNNVRLVYEDGGGNIWLGTKNGSLYVYDATLTQQLYTRKSINPYTISNDNCGRIWIGTKGNGVYVYDLHTQKEIAHYENDVNDASSLCHNSVFNILTDSRGRVWIATFGGGLDLVETSKTGKVSFRHFFNADDNKAFIRAIIEDHSGMIWAGSYDGLISFVPDELIADQSNYIVYQYNNDDLDGLNCKDVKCICEDGRQQLWVGTAGGGINRLYYENGRGKFEKITTRQGLPSDIVTSIVCSDDSTLWIGTENGLARLNLKNHSLVNLSFSGSTYGNYFNDNACVKRRNSHLLWGTLYGLLSFDPENVFDNRCSPKPILTELIVDGQMVNSMSEDSPLQSSLANTNNVSLRYDQNSFTITFASLNLTDPMSNKYSYMLEGFDTDWSATSASNRATYKRLPPGSYVFKVRNAVDDEQEFTSIEIVVVPPWWRSPIAMVLYAVLFVMLLLVTVFIINKINRLRNSITLEHELTDYKLRFFTNISHEFRTPLTLIRGTVDALLEDTAGLSNMAKGHIDILVRNTRHLSRLIDQLLEFRKIQNNVLTLNLEETNISTYVTDIFNSFSDFAEQKQIRYTIDVPEVWNILIDRNKVEKMVYNYISNAFKFTPDGGSICVRVHRSDSGWCIISVADTGCGIPKSKQSQVFKRFVQVNFSSNGTGVGLSLVKEFADVHHGRASYNDNPGGGAVFVVELPTDYSQFADVNIIGKEQQYDTDRLPQDIIEQEESADDVDLQYTVLVIDDNKDIRDFLSQRLSQHFAVITAENGKAGLEAVARQMPDLVISDVKMPIMDGLAFTQKIRSDFSTSHIPIILLTAHPSDSLQLESSESGADAYIMKPFSFKYLLSRIFKLIEQREMLRQRFAKQLQRTDDEQPDQNFMSSLDAIIENNAARNDFGIDDLISELNMSRSNIYKKLRLAADCTPGEYVKLWRMNMARKLIIEGGLTVSQVALKIGMEDPFYFSKCFKRQFGCSPSKYNSAID